MHFLNFWTNCKDAKTRNGIYAWERVKPLKKELRGKRNQVETESVEFYIAFEFWIHQAIHLLLYWHNSFSQILIFLSTNFFRVLSEVKIFTFQILPTGLFAHFPWQRKKSFTLFIHKETSKHV